MLIRKEAKTYGKKEMIIGQFEEGKKALVIEDVVTTGSSIIQTVEELKKVKIERFFWILIRNLKINLKN